MLEFFEQVGDPDLVRATNGDAGFDAAADVVAVDMAVPNAVAANDHDRVADLGPCRAELVDAVIVCVEEEHDLVPEVGDALLAVVRCWSGRWCLGDSHEVCWSNRQLTSVDGVQQCIEQE